MKGFSVRLMKTFSVMLLACAIMLPFSAKADTVSMTFTGVNGQIDNGYYIDPYMATVNGVQGTEIWCVDFNHHVNFGDTWTANVTPVSASSSNTYLNDLVKYEEMAWLVIQFPSQDSTNKAAIQWVIWDISSGLDHSSYYPTEYAYWFKQTQANYGTGNYSDWQILTDINHERQEFLVDAISVPEPSTLPLLVSGLVGLVGFRKKFRVNPN